jgi:calcineurin-like phosphoesterase family protein
MKASVAQEILPLLNGTKYLVAGNHDSYFKELCGTRAQIEHANKRALEDGYSALYLKLHMDIPGIGKVQLNHFPYSPIEKVNDPYDERFSDMRPEPDIDEKALIHGHIHGKWKYLIDESGLLPPMINVGVERWNLKPVSEEQIVDLYQEITKGKPL